MKIASYELKSAKFSAARPTENLLSKLKRAIKVGGRRLQRAGWLVGRVRSYLLIGGVTAANSCEVACPARAARPGRLPESPRMRGYDGRHFF